MTSSLLRIYPQIQDHDWIIAVCMKKTTFFWDSYSFLKQDKFQSVKEKLKDKKNYLVSLQQSND